jgi:hypothetical protein
MAVVCMLNYHAGPRRPTGIKYVLYFDVMRGPTVFLCRTDGSNHVKGDKIVSVEY